MKHTILIMTRFVRGTPNTSLFTQKIISASLFLHPGFIIVDHIHFQYNGFMYGILLLSILMARDVSVLVFIISFIFLMPHL